MRHAHPAHLSALVVLLAALFGAPPGWSQHTGEACHAAVRNGSGDLVRDIRGNEVLTVASVPCPTAIPQIVAATPAAPMPLLAAKPLFPYLSDVTLEVNGVRVAFDFDSACLRPEFEPTLDEIAAALHRHPGQGLTLTGHADAIGPERYNQGLSERRARAVAAYLRRAGVAPERLVVSGTGEKRPIAPNDSEAGRAQNRRVEIVAF